MLVQTIEDVPQPPSGRIMVIEEPIKSCSSLQGGDWYPLFAHVLATIVISPLIDCD